jgi:peroxiredoxin
MRLPDFSLATADGGQLTRADLAGRPWYAYLARHPGCYICQFKLADVLARREELRALGGDVVLFFNSGVEYTQKWTEQAVAGGQLPGDLTVAIDPAATLYEELGTIRSGMVEHPAKVLGSLWRARSHIGQWRLTPNDMLRMGADVAVRADGEIALRHICRDPEDRADPAAVIEALRVEVAA